MNTDFRRILPLLPKVLFYIFGGMVVGLAIGFALHTHSDGTAKARGSAFWSLP